jgi:hypothetical protein
LVTDTKHVNNEVGRNRGVNARLSPIGSIGYRDRSPSVTAQETSQADQTD